MLGLLNWYRCADNFTSVKGIVELMRKSCALSLARKHNKYIAKTYQTYGPDVKLELQDRIVSLPSIQYVMNLSSKFTTSSLTGFDLDKITAKYQFRLSHANQLFTKCAVLNCTN